MYHQVSSLLSQKLPCLKRGLVGNSPSMTSARRRISMLATGYTHKLQHLENTICDDSLHIASHAHKDPAELDWEYGMSSTHRNRDLRTGNKKTVRRRGSREWCEQRRSHCLYACTHAACARTLACGLYVKKTYM